MSFIVVLPLDIDANDASPEWLGDVGQQVSASVGRAIRVQIPPRTRAQLACWRALPSSPWRDGLRERGASFGPHLHVIVADKAVGASGLRNAQAASSLGYVSGLANVLFPIRSEAGSSFGRRMPSDVHSQSDLVRSQAFLTNETPQDDAGEMVTSVCLGFTLTVGTLMLLGAVNVEGTSSSALTFDILTAGGNRPQAEQPTLYKKGDQLSVSLPNGSKVAIAPHFVEAINRYISAIAAA